MMRIFASVVAGVALVLCTASACGPTTAPPEPAGPPGLQVVPQMNPHNGLQADVLTYCLTGSQLRVFVSRDGHGRDINSVVNTSNLLPIDPYRCSR